MTKRQLPKAKARKTKAASVAVVRVVTPPEELRPKQRRFVEEYMLDMNGTQAAIRAGYSSSGANVTGVRLLSNPTVMAYLEALEEGRSERIGMTADDVLSELLLLVRSNVRDYVFTDADLTLAPGVPEAAWRAVSSIKRKVRTIPQEKGDPIIEIDQEFKLWDKNAAIEKAMKHLKLTGDPAGAGLFAGAQVEIVVRREA